MFKKSVKLILTYFELDIHYHLKNNFSDGIVLKSVTQKIRVTV